MPPSRKRANTGDTSATSSKRRKSHQSQNPAQDQDQSEFVLSDVDFQVKLARDPDNYKPDKDETMPTKRELGFGDELDGWFTVTPASWDTLDRYKKFTITEATFSVGEYVFVEPDVKDNPKWHDALSPTLHERWTARVLDCRAIDASRVYLLVFWLNRPEDHTTLQNRLVGRQPHHGFNELIATNRPDIIDAMTVTDKASVRHWNEFDDDDEPGEGEVFFRQSYNFFDGKLSKLRTHCKCQKPSNPDKLLIRCEKDNCKTWLHDECLVKDLAETLLKEAAGTTNGLSDQNTIAVQPALASSTPQGTPRINRRSMSTPQNQNRANNDDPQPTPDTIKFGTLRISDPVAEERKSGKIPSIFRIISKAKPPSFKEFTVEIREKTVNRVLRDPGVQGGEKIHVFAGEGGPAGPGKWEREIRCLKCAKVVD